MKGKNSFKIIDLSLKYSRITIMIVTAILLTGIYGLYVMPKKDFASFTIRQGVVICVQPGLTSTEIEEQITEQLEEFILNFDEIKKGKTTSQSRDGVCIINIELKENIHDTNTFWSKFKHKLNNFKQELPPDVLSLFVIDDFGETSAFLFSIESSTKSYEDIKNYIDALKKDLRNVEGISNIKEYGLLKEQITLYIDQDKLSHYGFGYEYITAKLFLQGLTLASGNIDDSKIVIPIHVENQYVTEKDIGEQIIYSDLDGNIVRLKDIAKIVREYPNSSPYIEHNGTKCVLLSIDVGKNENVVEIGNDVNQIVDIFKDNLPDDVIVGNICDLSQVVNKAVISFLIELLIAVVAVVSVVLIFMPKRIAFVAAITIPITMFSSLAVFYLIGIELNTVIFSALIVTLGMVVDDSVVIIDNYVEQLDEGKSRLEAAIESPKKYFKSVLTATLVISVTFFPFLWTTKGMFNDFLSFYPWAMTIILGLSLIIALLFVPFLQYTFIKKGINESSARRRIIFEKIQIFYRKLLIYCLQKPKITLLVGFIVTLLGMFLYFEQPLRLMPGVDRNQFCVEIYLPNGKSLDQTALLSDSLRRMLSQDKRVKSITSFIGSGSPRFHDTYVPQFPADNYAQFIVMTDNEKETIELLDKYSNKYANYFPNAYIKFKQLDYSEARYPIELRLTGDSINELKSTADSLLFHLRQMKELTIVHTNLEEQLIGTSIKLNDSEMSKLGIYRPTISLHSLINIGEGIPIARLWEKTRSIPVILKGSSSDTINSIENLNIPAMGGITSVPLRQIGVIAPDWNEGQIYHRNGKRSLSIIAEMQRGYNENEVAHIIETKILPKVSISKNINVSFGGIKESDMERLPQILFGLLVAIVIMFFILTFHFKKISLALLTLCSTILCFFGSGVGMLIMNTDISLTSILGIVSLIGILLRNGIILIDYTEFLRKNKNFDVYTAALEASIRRIRPILLTSIAAAVGVIPMLIEGSSLWKPLGTVIFFGTIITVFFIATILPVSYVLLYKSKNEK